MTMRDELRERWFVGTLSILASLFFTAALVFSAATYVSVMDAKQRVELRDAVEDAVVLQNGSIEISLTIDLVNPSGQTLTMSSISWNVKVVNESESGTAYIPLLLEYGVAPEYSTLGAHETLGLEFSAVISSPEKISNLEGFIDYWQSRGQPMTIETIPYLHDFRMIGWMGDYQHDYQYYKETYLNDLVRVDKRYLGGEYL